MPKRRDCDEEESVGRKDNSPSFRVFLPDSVRPYSLGLITLSLVHVFSDTRK